MSHDSEKTILNLYLPLFFEQWRHCFLSYQEAVKPCVNIHYTFQVSFFFSFYIPSTHFVFREKYVYIFICWDKFMHSFLIPLVYILYILNLSMCLFLLNCQINLIQIYQSTLAKSTCGGKYLEIILSCRDQTHFNLQGRQVNQINHYFP